MPTPPSTPSRRGCASASNRGEAGSEAFLPDIADRQRLDDQMPAPMPTIAQNQGATTRQAPVVAPERISAEH